MIDADRTEKLSLLHVWARGQYNDPTVPFNTLHSQITYRFMEIMKSPGDEAIQTERKILFDIWFKTITEPVDGRRVSDLITLLTTDGWIVEGSFGYRDASLGGCSIGYPIDKESGRCSQFRSRYKFGMHACGSCTNYKDPEASP